MCASNTGLGRTDLSVIIPTWNRADMVTLALKSLISQDYHGVIEIIVVDDGSEDGTVSRLREFSSSVNDPMRRIVLIEKAHTGITDSIRTGVLASTANYISLLGSDDIWAADRARLLIEAVSEETRIVLIYTNWLLVGEDNAIVSINGLASLPNPEVIEWTTRQGHSLYRGFTSYYIPGGASIFSRSLLDGDFLLPPDLPQEDLWLGLCALLRGKIKFLQNHSLAVRRHHRQHSREFAVSGGTVGAWIRQEMNLCREAERLLCKYAPNEKKLLKYFEVRKRLFEARQLKLEGKILKSLSETVFCLGPAVYLLAVFPLLVSNVLFCLDARLIARARALQEKLRMKRALSAWRRGIPLQKSFEIHRNSD